MKTTNTISSGLYQPSTMPGSVFSSSSRQPYSNVLITGWGAASKDETVIEYHRKRLGPYFETITFAKEAIPSDDELKAADVVYGLPNGSWFKSASQVPRLKLIQLVSAGSERVVNSPLWKDEKAKDIKLTSASGVHTGPIPQVRATDVAVSGDRLIVFLQYFIATTLMLFHRLQQQILIGQVRRYSRSSLHNTQHVRRTRSVGAPTTTSAPANSSSSSVARLSVSWATATLAARLRGCPSHSVPKSSPQTRIRLRFSTEKWENLLRNCTRSPLSTLSFQLCGG